VGTLLLEGIVRRLGRWRVDGRAERTEVSGEDAEPEVISHVALEIGRARFAGERV
jgi:hypothetical protein